MGIADDCVRTLLAEAVAEGVKEVPGGVATLRRVPETLPANVLQMMGAVEAQKVFAHVPVATVEELPDYDAIVFGTPTRFGNMCGQMRKFLDATGGPEGLPTEPPPLQGGKESGSRPRMSWPRHAIRGGM